jgi:hypothetical protein
MSFWLAENTSIPRHRSPRPPHCLYDGLPKLRLKLDQDRNDIELVNKVGREQNVEPPDPARQIEEAASLSLGDRWSEKVALAAMQGLDAIVCGSVAVTRDGRRCGKGEGYSDLEFAVLRELGHPPVPVATTVHDLPVVTSVPRDSTAPALSALGVVVMIAKLRTHSPADARQFSQSPARAISPRSASAIA